MTHPRRTALALAAILLAGSALAGAAAAQDKVLRVIPHADPKVIDPIVTTAYITRNLSYMVMDVLFAQDAAGKIQPQMAESVAVSADKLTYTIRLRDGLRWHDGADVTAEDCVLSIKRWGARDSMGQKLMSVVAGFEQPNAKTIVIKLKEPYGLVLESLGKISSNVPFMMPKRLAETDPAKSITELVGSGPFIFDKAAWVPGSKIVVRKNPNYVPRKEPVSAAAGGKIAKVDRIEWLIIPDPTTAMNALINGEVDYYENPPPDLIPLLERQKDKVNVAQLDPLGNQGMLRLNHKQPPFDKVEARQAIAKLMDQKLYMQTAVGNPLYWKECFSFYACGSALENKTGYDAFMKPDLDAAKALLKQAGYDGRKIVIMQPTDIPVTSAASLITADLMRKAGINVDLQAMDWATVISRRASKETPDKGGWHIFPTWWIGGDISNPITHAGIAAACDRSWFGWPCDEAMESLRDQFAKSTDEAKKKELANAIQKRALEIVTHVNFGTWFNPVAYRVNVTGMIPSPVQFFWNMGKS
ncbi:MAG: ABC transporter substrate-binding protein [Alphaproteobacteria bacterium]|nr:ABC transporter substrate-binding protein [Alphaproteobacteria bacterium]